MEVSQKRKVMMFALEDRLQDYGIKAIYFELGKLIAHSDRLESLTTIRSQIDYLMEQEKLRNEQK